MSVAFVHDWLNGMRGGEKCLESLLDIFPQAPIFTLLCEPEKISEKIKKSQIRTSWIQKLPAWRLKYRYYLPLFPWAIRSLSLGHPSLVISVSHCAAKGVRLPRGARHVSYCLTPMRYLWGFYEEYFGKGPYHGLKRLGLNLVMNLLRRWDLKTVQNVNYFIAISNHVAERIQRFYKREAVVIYPPVDGEKFCYREKDERQDYFLIVSALVPYKKIELAIEVFNEGNCPLKVIGAGTELDRLKRMAKNHIEFLGWRSDEELRQYYAQAQALIFPGEEDFGITPLEAQACGTPVIAFRKGGALETVREGETGLFFDEQTKESLSQVLEKFKSFSYDRKILRQNALRFGKDVFLRDFKKFLKERNLLE
ncbi:MAG: glycosyltransferase [Chlamydiae bacterium]|nr:glycosyltransferase [Chlamydiota bacterium]MBI3266080.1 glycosyltransferase [Chlamydiota bacterium]